MVRRLTLWKQNSFSKALVCLFSSSMRTGQTLEQVPLSHLFSQFRGLNATRRERKKKIHAVNNALRGLGSSDGTQWPIFREEGGGDTTQLMCCKLKCASERACGDVLYPSSSIVCIMLFAGAFFAQVIQQKRSSTTVLLADAQKDLLLPFMELKTAVRFFSLSLSNAGGHSFFALIPGFCPS